jgi:FtsH-binding integral membrane protein
MDPSPQNENIQYQPSGFAPYNAKAAEPIMQPQQENYSQPVYGNEFPESMEKMDVDNVDVSINYMIRRGFIIKTYGILISQLAITCIFICLSFVPSINKFIKSKDFVQGSFFISFLVLFLFVTIFVCCMFSCCRDTARKVPINYILLFSFTLCMSFYCFIFCAFFEPKDVIVAAILTMAATTGLTVYASRTKTDFSFLGGLLFCFSFVFFFSIIFYFWIQTTVFWLMFGVLIYSIYLIYDTQLIMGNVGIQYNIDDYCFAALNLYIDIIYLFLKILQLIAALKGK